MATANDIQKLYRETLGRDAGKEGLDYWSKDLSKGHTLDDVRKGIQNSDEYKNRSKSVINTAYNDLLGRDAGSAGLEWWGNDLKKGHTVNDIRSGITQSDEFKNRLKQKPAETQPNFRPAERASISEAQTVEGRLNGLLSSDSPLMKRAATQGMQVANSRGLLNSSMAAGAAQGAMIDRATPIASQDSSQFANLSQFNAGQENQMRSQENAYLSNSALSDQQYQQNLGLNQQGFQYDMGRMQADYGFSSQLSTQEAQQSLEQLRATSTANGWGVMANNLTDIVGQYSSQLERIQMNPDIEEADKVSLIEQVLAMRDTDIKFQQSLYEQLPNYPANTGVFPNR